MERNVVVFVDGFNAKAFSQRYENARFVGFKKAENGFADIMMYYVTESQAQEYRESQQ